MKKAFSGKLLIVSSLLVLLAYGAISACGYSDDDYWDLNNQSNFAPEAFADQKFAPLFLSQGLFYNSGLEPYTRFNGDIMDDWKKYLSGKMTDEQVHFFLLDSSDADVNSIYDYYRTEKQTPAAQKWASKFNLADKKIKGFISFLHYAKQIESASVSPDYWDYEQVRSKAITDKNLLAEIENIYNNTQDKFLKNRYWFQVMKGYFYSDTPSKGIDFFESTENTVPKNKLYYRALSYAAGIHSRLGQVAKSNYLYSKVFGNCESMRDIAVFCFGPQEEKDWQESLGMAKNNEEKSALWAIRGYYGDEENAIAAIYEEDPKSDYLDFLLTRLVNNQEMRINKDFHGKTVQQSKAALKDTLSQSAIQLLNRIAESGKTPRPYLWHAAAGYMETLHGNFKKADGYFDKVEKKMPKTALAINQIRLLRFVNNLSKLDKITPNDENALVNDLKWLYEELPGKQPTLFRYTNAAEWSKNYLSALYKAQQNDVMSELFIRDQDFYYDDGHLKQMKAFLSKTDKSAFEKIANAIYKVNLNDINLYQAVKATFENKISEAIGFMQNSGELKDIEFQSNPFNGFIKDCHDCEHYGYRGKKFTNISFLTTMQQLQDKISKSEDAYTNYLLLANAFYSITHYGNGRVFTETEIIGYGNTPFDLRTDSRQLVTDCSLAKMYYEKALQSAKTNEQKAKCHYMLAKCERNEFYNEAYSTYTNSWDVESDDVNFLEWKGFQALKKDFSKTKYFQEVIQECGYFRTYINQSKK